MIKKILGGIFGGSGAGVIESIATEWIQTDQEKAEAQTVMIKALDPNGMMRRKLSERVGSLYSIYLITTLSMLFVEFSFRLAGADIGAVGDTTDKIKELFVPISTLFGIIVTASFGVNYANTKSGK